MKNPFTSKIVWVQISAMLAVLAVLVGSQSFDVFVDMETKIKILAGISVVQSLITGVLRVFFTNTNSGTGDGK